MSSSGIRTSDIFSYLSNEAGGSENLNFIQSDCYNFVSKTKTEFLCRRDAQCLLEYLTKKVEGNRSYFYKLRMDEDNRICSSFFSDPKSRCDYANFGDVVCFDTTYKTNNYNMICAPFVGVNHHAQTVIFGCGLLDCETTESFVWLFQTFLNAMGGKQPQTIFTDQAGAIANAIKHVFPTVHHRLCLWHIYQNAAKNLSNVFSQFQSFSKDLKNCIYEPETVDEFECWDSLLGKYELHENAWLENLYGLKEKWAQVYARSHFCAGMTTTQRSESINNFLKHFFAGNLILRQFVEQFDRALADRRMKERQSDTRTRQTSPILVTEWGVEREASIKYTRKIFQLFQDELKKSFTLKCKLVNDDGTMRSYSVRDMRRQSARVRTVTCMISDTFLVTCSCRKFEFHGILCAHILKFFLDELEVSSLPSQYFLPRWCVDAASRLVYDGNGYLINSDLDPLASRRYSELMYFAQTVAAKGAITDEKSAIAKSEMINVIAKLDSIQITDEQGKTQHDSNTPVFNDHVERRNTSSGSRALTLLDPVSKKRTGEAKGRLKSALDNRPKPKRKSKSTISKSVPVVLPNQDLNFPDYSLNQLHQQQSVYPPSDMYLDPRYPTFQVPGYVHAMAATPMYGLHHLPSAGYPFPSPPPASYPFQPPLSASYPFQPPPPPPPSRE